MARGQDRPSSTRAFSCPAHVMVSASATVQGAWKVEGSGQSYHKFLRPSIFNGTPGREEFELAQTIRMLRESGFAKLGIWRTTVTRIYLSAAGMRSRQ